MHLGRLLRVLLPMGVLVGALHGVGACGRKGIGGEATGGDEVTVRVLAAASLAGAFREVGAAFEAAHPDVRVEFSFAGSNQLRTQLEQGGPGDVLATADRKQMDAALASKVVAGTTITVFAHNSLSLIVPAANRAGIGSLADIARPGLKVVVADTAVPAGNYTGRLLEKAAGEASLGPSFVAAVERNIVSREENVSAVVAKVALGEADAGFAYASDAVGGGGRGKVTPVALPPGLAPRAEYVAAVIARTSNASLAGAFVSFVASKQGGAILSAHGFDAPVAAAP